MMILDLLKHTQNNLKDTDNRMLKDSDNTEVSLPLRNMISMIAAHHWQLGHILD